ncbi:MAG: glutathione S-transferase family protein [Pseudomonadota bacterium]
MYTLYGDLRSGSSIIELLLSHLQISYNTIRIDLEKNAQRDSSYLTVNPQGKLPCLVKNDGQALTETVAILVHLLENHAQSSSLLPPIGIAERDTAWRWLLYVATEIYPLVEINDYPERFCAHTELTEETREVARELWRKRWSLVEQQISGNPFLLPSGLCVTDFYIAVVSRWAQQDHWRRKHLPKVENIAEAVATLPGCDAVWTKHFPN